MLAFVGQITAQPGDVKVTLWRFPSGEERSRIVGSSAPGAHAFSPDGRLLAIGYRDGSMILWDASRGEEVFRGDFRSQPITQLAFTPNGTSLAVSDGKSPVQLLDLIGLRRQLAKIRLDW